MYMKIIKKSNYFLAEWKAFIQYLFKNNTKDFSSKHGRHASKFLKINIIFKNYTFFGKRLQKYSFEGS